MKLLAGVFIVVALAVGSAWAAPAQGKTAYEKSCKSCHGADGKGDPSIAKVMKVELKPIGGLPDSDVKHAIVKGKGKMRPVASVTGKQVDDVVAYVKTVK